MQKRTGLNSEQAPIAITQVFAMADGHWSRELCQESAQICPIPAADFLVIKMEKHTFFVLRRQLGIKVCLVLLAAYQLEA